MHQIVLLTALSAAVGQFGGARSTCPSGTCSRVQQAPAYRPAPSYTYAAPSVYRYPAPAPSYPPAPTPAAPVTYYQRGYSQVAAPQPASAPVPATYAAPAPMSNPPATTYRWSTSTCPYGTCSRR